MFKPFFLVSPILLLSTPALAFGSFELTTQMQQTHITREYESHFKYSGEQNRTYNGLDAKVWLFELGISMPVSRSLEVVGSISLGDDERHNEQWIHHYSLDNNIGTQPSTGGYNQYSDGHLKYKNYRVGLEQQASQLLTMGVYLAKEEVDSRAGTLHSSAIPATKYFEDSWKLEGYSDIHSPTVIPNVSIGIQNIITLRRSDVEQSFWYQGENNWVSFSAPSVQFLTSPYVVAQFAPNLVMRMSLTHSVFGALRQNDAKFDAVTLNEVSEFGVDSYSGSQTNLALNATWAF